MVYNRLCGCDIVSKYKKGDIVSGVVTGVEDYGAFLSLEDGYVGLIHISEITRGFVANINNYLKKGDSVEAKVVFVDEKNKKLNLSIKYRTKKRSTEIEEVGNGFLPLKEKLDSWINEKYDDINNER